MFRNVADKQTGDFNNTTWRHSCEGASPKEREKGNSSKQADSRTEEADRKDEERRAQHDTEDDVPTPAMYANNVSNLDQILSSLQCYLVRTRLDTHAPSLASAWRG